MIIIAIAWLACFAVYLECAHRAIPEEAQQPQSEQQERDAA
jgi:hypothetical protein